MGGDGIYRKTEKGRTEIATRANRLGMRERTMLIMVDDKTTRAGLLAKNTHPTSEGILNSLLADGYIEVAGGAPGATEGGAPTAPPAPAPDPSIEVSLPSASRFACRALVTYLGPTADELTGLVERSKNATELAGVLARCRDIIQAMAGRQKAEAFWAGVTARLPRS